MNGEVVARIREYGADLIGHIHTAGVPVRCEPGETQDLDYQPIMQAMFEISYEGYEGQEFIPTRNPMDGFRFQDSGLKVIFPLIRPHPNIQVSIVDPAIGIMCLQSNCSPIKTDSTFPCLRFGKSHNNLPIHFE